jgi:hypothetical protein
MKTLKEISAMFPGKYRVIDNTQAKGRIKTWDDNIEIIIDHKSKFCKRRSAYKLGLVTKAD